MDLLATMRLLDGDLRDRRLQSISGYGTSDGVRKAWDTRGRKGDQTMPRGRQSFKKIDSTLRQAGSARHLVIMDYEGDAPGEAKTYKVEPYSYRDNQKRFFAYDRVEKSIKGFMTDKIIRVQPTNESFKPRWPVELVTKKVA